MVEALDGDKVKQKQKKNKICVELHLGGQHGMLHFPSRQTMGVALFGIRMDRLEGDSISTRSVSTWAILCGVFEDPDLDCWRSVNFIQDVRWVGLILNSSLKFRG